MSAEPKPTIARGAWTTWENQVVDGRFTLRRYLGGSDHGAVFLTEHKAENLAEAAIKFVRADAPQAKTLLAHWKAAMALSHPHLVQLFEVGRWQSGGNDYLFVVMEYGDQTLAEILRRRALGAEETLELLPPVLDALTFLHRRQLVHGRVKPSNLLAVGDQLKLTSDTIRRAGEDQSTSTAGDVWNLGATLVEALTRRVLTEGDHSFDIASLPAGLPASLVKTVRCCLAPTPADRPSAIELRAEYKLPAPAQPASDATREPVPPQPGASRESTPPQPAPSASRETAPPQPIPSLPQANALPRPGPVASREEPPPSAPKRRLLLSGIAAALLLLLAFWGGSHFTNESQPSLQTTVTREPTPAAPSASPQIAVPEPTLSPPATTAEQATQPPTTTSSSVLNEVLPTVPDKVRSKIQGRVYVTVRVLVDNNGKVIAVLMENAGPSKYFARLSDQAARQWQFIPADTQDSRVWLIRFQYTRDGVVVRTTAQ